MPATRKPILITGGSSGIGEGLARAFHARGATVIVTGRNPEALARLAQACPGLETETLDVRDPVAVAACAQAVTARHPELDTVVNNAGIQRKVDFAADGSVPPAEIDPEIDTNLKGTIYVTTAFLPHLRRQPSARLVQVTSGLAYVPMVPAPIYSATKAGARAFAVTLREQLRGTTVRVIELAPPLVETNLHNGQPGPPPKNAMKLEEFVRRAMNALDSGREELPIGLAARLRIGARIAPRLFLKLINRPQ